MKDIKYQRSFQSLNDCRQQIREIVQGRMQTAILDMVYQLFEDELHFLCGPRYDRKAQCSRAGSDPGSIYANGQRVLIKKPRVKKKGREVEVKTYSALRDYDLLSQRIKEYMLRGVSTRDYEPLLDEISKGTGLKKSSVSKAFVKSSRGALDDFNSRNLSDLDFVSLMIDGVNFSERTVVVALGIDIKGKKHILGLREGSTENWELCRDLFENLLSRGLKSHEEYLFIIDGSRALRKAIRKVFGNDCIVQRCVRHKERNIIKYLPKQRHREFGRRWKRLHGSVNYQMALREYEDLVHWLGHINHCALDSLEESEKETLTVIRFNVPPLLKKTLLSTNPIESAFSYTQYRVGRVKNWRTSSDQVGRWAATILLESETRFRTIKGFMHLPKLKEELKNNIEKQKKVA